MKLFLFLPWKGVLMLIFIKVNNSWEEIINDEYDHV